MSDFAENFILPIFVAAVVIGSICIGLEISSLQCHAEWENSGLAIDWSPLKGCLIKTSEGHWIPAQRYREFGQPR